MSTPTTEPAVPGALGAKPAPPAVAIAIATQSLLVFEMAIGVVDFLWRPFVGGYAILAAGPSTQVDQLAALATERAVGIVSILGFLVAGRAFHGLSNYSAD